LAARRRSAVRNRRLAIEQFENRCLLADINLTSLQLIEKDFLSTSITPIIGEQVCIRANFTTSSLPAGSSYRIEFKLDSVPISVSNVTSGAGLASGSWFYYQCGWYASPGQHSAQALIDADNTVAESNEANNTRANPLLFTPVAPTTLPQKLLNPLGGVPFHDWRFSNYVDVDPTSGIKDFQGGTIAIDGHTAHDIGGPNFTRMDQGVPEYAAADGVVEDTQDGNFDRNTISGSRPANYVVINHGNGWRTIYYHLMANSITVQIGDTVKAGQLLGLMGSSGDANGPHLHFGVTHNNNPIETEYDSTDFYVSPYGYQGSQPTYVLDALVTSFSPTSSDFDERPAEQTVFSTLMPQTPVLVFWFSSLASGEHLDLTEYRPDGTVNSTNSALVQGPLNSGAYWWRPSSTPISSSPGTWRLVIAKNGVELASRSFVVTTGVGNGQIKVTQNGSDISDNRTTAFDFGSAAQGGAAVSQIFTINNVGSAPLGLSGLALPPGFALHGSFPSSILPGSSSSFTIDLTTAVVGSKFGAIQFSTTDPDSPTFNFNVSGTVTGSSPAAAPVLSISGPALAYTKFGQAMLIKPAAMLTDADSANFDGGTLTAEFTSISSTADILGIQNGGSDAGQISISGAMVSYGGVPIGILADGSSGTPLSVSFNSAATPDAVQALIRSITFSTTATHPENLSRYVRLSVTDESGNLSNQPIAVVDQNLYPTTASVDSNGNLLIADSSVAGKDDGWRLERSGDSLKLTDLSGYFIDASSIAGSTGNVSSVVTIPLAAFSASGQVILDTRNGNDSLTIDLSSGNPIPAGGINFLGGNPTTAPGDKLTITGGNQGTVTYNYFNTSSHDGNIVMSNYGTVYYAGLEPIINSGTATDIIFNLPAGPNTVTLGDDGSTGNSLSQLSAGTFEKTDFATPTGTLTINRGNSADALTINDLPDFTAGMAIGSVANPIGTLTFAGAVALAAGKSLSAYASGKISAPNATSSVGVSGVGGINLTTSRNIVISAGANFSVVDGDLSFTANQAGATAGNFTGISMTGTLTTSGKGNITLTGTGGVDSTTGLHLGIDVLRGVVRSVASGPSAGKILLTGKGGVGTTDNDGVAVEGVGGVVQSVSGDIQINGTGGNGSTTLNRGIALINSGQIQSTGTGDNAAYINLIGFGGNGTDSNYGVNFGTTVLLMSVDGDISISGQASLLPTGSFNYGVFASSGVITTIGSGSNAGNIEITGIGGGTGDSGSVQNQGVRISGSSTSVNATDGNITIRGTGGTSQVSNNTFEDGVRLVNQAQIQTSGSGSIALTGTAGSADTDVGVGIRLGGTISSKNALDSFTADSIVLDSANLTINAGTGQLTIRPVTAGINIDLGTTSDPAGTLALSDAELGVITADTLQIGDSNSGPIAISADIHLAQSQHVSLASNSSITFVSGSIQTALGGLSLSPGGSSFVSVSNPGTDATIGSNAALSFASGSDLKININGTVADSQYDQLDVNGGIDLTDVDLVLSGTYSPTIGDQLVIVNDDGSGDVIGEFNGLPDGKPFHIASGALAGDYAISYHGGDGNDVVVTAISLIPTLHAIADPPAIDEDAERQQVPLTGIGPGYGHSILHVTAESSNPSLIPDPDIAFSAADGTGTLFFKPNADQFGTAIITVTVQDDGGAADDRVDEFMRTFTVTVNPVDDPPSFTISSPSDCSTADENPTHGPALPQVCHNVIRNLSPGPPNEADQPLTISIAANNDSLFTATGLPSIDLATGSLSFTRMPNTFGLATLTITVTDSAGASDSQQLNLNCTKPHREHNSANSGDRNGKDVTGSTTPAPDGFIVAADVLAVINYINAHGSGPVQPAVNAPPYVDVDADDQIVANDALLIINWVNAHPGQSEAPDDVVTAPTSMVSSENTDQSITAIAIPIDLMNLLAADSASAQLKRRRLPS
jgi:murein DD-endopeptidase MepM/ murein hydrolase activator NlpD